MKTRVKGTKELSAKLKNLGTDVDNNLELALVAGGLILQNGMKQRVRKDTRTLARSIHIGGHEDGSSDSGDSSRPQVPQPERSRGRVKIFIGTNLEYAAIHEFGGEITPKRARALRFKVKGEWVTVKRVRITAQPYMRPAFDEDGPEARREVGEALRDIIRASVRR